MIRNFAIMAFRCFLRNKLIFVVNLGGFSIALAFGVLAIVYVHNDWTYDRFHVNAPYIYRVCLEREDRFNAVTPWPLGPALTSRFPDLKIVRVHRSGGFIGDGEKSFRVKVSLVDPLFLKVFSFPLATGDASTALRDLRSIVITEKVARKLFPDTDPVGKVVMLNRGSEEAYTVSGVLSSIPENSSIMFDCLLPLDPAGGGMLNSWSVISGTTTYVLLPEFVDRSDLQYGLDEIVKRGWGKETKASLFLQPLKEIHFDRRIRGVETVGSPGYGYVMLGIAFIVIAIASVNFVALTIGRMSMRTKEVGVRRLLGAKKRQLIAQYLGESILLALIALTLSVVLVDAMLPRFNSLVGTQISLYGQASVTKISYVVTLAVATGVVAGLFPAVVFSRLQPAEVLCGRSIALTPGLLMRFLLVVQSAMAMVLVMGTLAMAIQYTRLIRMNPGFEINGVIVVETGDLVFFSPGVVDVYMKRIAAYPNVLGVARSQHPLNSRYFSRGFVEAEGITIRDVETIAVDHDFLKTLGFTLLEGRNFAREMSSDRRAVIVNEAFKKQFGWHRVSNNVIDLNGNGDHEVIGVVQDFHFRSYHHKVGPAVFFLSPEYCRRVFVRIASEERNALDILRKEWEDIAPSKPFRAAFLQDELKHQYKKDRQWLNAVQFSAILALSLSCLGAFALTSLAVAHRAKEIGIRKVFGSTTPRLMALLCSDFLKLTGLATLFASPVAYYTLREWLQSFSYRIDLIVPIIAGGGLTFVIVLLVVSYRTYRGATLNPVATLRCE